MPSPNLSEVVTTTLRNRSRVLADNVTKNTALLSRLEQKGKIKPVDGGRTIVEELFYAENSTYTRYSGYDQINIQPSDVITSAEYNYAQAAVAVVMSGLEMLQNSGENAVVDWLDARIENAEMTFRNNMSADIYSDGTANGGKQIGGLALLVPDNPTTGTVGGIPRSLWPFWRSTKFSGVTDGGAAVSAATIQGYMNRVYLAVSRNNDRPDLIVADNNYFRFYWESLQAIQRITDTRKGVAGFSSLQFMDADVVFDGGIGGAATTNHMWFLNTNYICFRPHSKRNMEVLDPDRFAVNQDAIVKLIAFAGNLTLRNASLQGVLIA